jgi:hypothetical protein
MTSTSVEPLARACLVVEQDCITGILLIACVLLTASPDKHNDRPEKKQRNIGIQGSLLKEQRGVLSSFGGLFRSYLRLWASCHFPLLKA